MAKKRSTSSTPPAASAKRPLPGKEFHDYAEDIDEIQGYLFSRPVPAETFTKLLQEERCLPPGLQTKQRGLNFSDP